MTTQTRRVTESTLFESERARLTLTTYADAPIDDEMYDFVTTETRGIAHYAVDMRDERGVWYSDLHLEAPMYDETVRAAAVKAALDRIGEIENADPRLLDIKVSDVYWIAMGGYESIIDVIVRGQRVLVDAETLDEMALAIVDCGLVSKDEDAAYAAEIRATQPLDDGLYDVTDFGGEMFEQGLLVEHGIVVDRAK